jgi:hypothetical protein
MKERRFPIVLDNNTIMLIRLFTGVTHLEDLWLYDEAPPLNTPDVAAKQLISQLEDHWTPAFLMALRDEITKKLKEHDKQYKTKFAGRQK